MQDKRISIFIGHFGSGKTEVAVNYAIKLAKTNPKTCIVDLDIINPYFRTADAKEELERKGIWVILPMYANTNVDVPVLPSEMNTIFEKKEYKAVFDIGGEDVGAKAISRYMQEIQKDSYELFAVINVKRPMTETVDKIEEMVYDLEQASRLKITKLVNNTNLLEYTTLDDILYGQEIVEKASAKLNIPIGFTSGMSSVLNGAQDKIGNELLKLNKLIKLPWDNSLT